MCEIKFHVKVPMDTWRQWIRHRTANVNEYSTRYSIAIDDADVTLRDQWRLQSPRNKQGSQGFLDSETGADLSKKEADLLGMARTVYEERLLKGVAREQARKDLPLSAYTEAYWKIDLWNLFHFLELRMSENAQAEIRQYATVIGQYFVATWVPLAWEAFLDYRLNAVHLSALETQLMRAVIEGDESKLRKLFESLHWLDWDAKKNKLKANRERDEFLAKVKRQFAYSIPLVEGMYGAGREQDDRKIDRLEKQDLLSARGLDFSL